MSRRSARRWLFAAPDSSGRFDCGRPLRPAASRAPASPAGTHPDCGARTTRSRARCYHLPHDKHGEKIPDFALPDQYGRIQTLDTIMGERGAMLVFHRSADW